MMLSPSLYVRLSLFFHEPFLKNLMKLVLRFMEGRNYSRPKYPAFVKCRGCNLLPVCVLILSVWCGFEDVNRQPLMYYAFILLILCQMIIYNSVE